MLTRRNRNYRTILLRRVFAVLSPIVFIGSVSLILVINSGTLGQNELRPSQSGVTNTTIKEVSVGLPVRLTVPSLAIDAKIGYAGTNEDGSMAVSSSQDDVAWYQPGNNRPGNDGTAVIAGHYGSLNGKYSVFSNLSSLKPGDKLQVEDHLGALTSFVVRDSRMYDPAADAKDVFTSSDNNAHLNLITCEGTWNNNQQTYSQRRVVFTDLVASE